jgi:type VI secretion system protein ImpK
MREEIANLVHPVLSHGLRLKERLERGEELDFDNEQAVLKGLLLSHDEARRWADYGGDKGALDHSALGRSMGRGQAADPVQLLSRTFFGIRYTLACWLDEIFIVDSPWSARWRENKLESMLYGTNDRAWGFWDQAKLAESRQGSDALEVFFLCVMLGFRGQWRDQPDKLQAWVSATQARITRSHSLDYPLPHDKGLTTEVPPLRGRERFKKMVLGAAVFILVCIPVLVFFLMRRLLD